MKPPDLTGYAKRVGDCLHGVSFALARARAIAFGPDLVCSTGPAPVNAPLVTAHSISPIVSTLAETSDPTSSRQFSTGATQK